MFVIEKPYVSPLLAETLLKEQIPVLRTPQAETLLPGEVNWVEEETAVQQIHDHGRPLLYSNSENSIAWIAQSLGFTDLPEKIDLFKNKIRFRKLLQKLYPNLFFQAVPLTDLERLDVSALPKPFIVKPASGFMSLGVHRVSDNSEWPGVLKAIHADLDGMSRIYPREVLNITDFIIEGFIPGDEFAVDVYFDAQGQPVILNILRHFFASEQDMSDRVYITSRDIVQSHLEPVGDFMHELGRQAGLTSFPMHAEFRFGPEGRPVPIEINPLRFAGWCTTDVAWHAWGINVYEMVHHGRRPDWESILERATGDITLMSVAEVPADVDAKAIRRVDYEGLAAEYCQPLEVRKVDYQTYRVLAFVFDRIPEAESHRIDEVLHADLKRFIT